MDGEKRKSSKLYSVQEWDEMFGSAEQREKLLLSLLGDVMTPVLLESERAGKFISSTKSGFQLSPVSEFPYNQLEEQFPKALNFSMSLEKAKRQKISEAPSEAKPNVEPTHIDSETEVNKDASKQNNKLK